MVFLLYPSPAVSSAIERQDVEGSRWDSETG